MQAADFGSEVDGRFQKWPINSDFRPSDFCDN